MVPGPEAPRPRPCRTTERSRDTSLPAPKSGRRVATEPFVDHEGGQAHGGDSGERGDVVRPEPVVFLSLVEHDLKRTDADRQQREADVIDAESAPCAHRQVGWVLHESRHRVSGRKSVTAALLMSLHLLPLRCEPGQEVSLAAVYSYVCFASLDVTAKRHLARRSSLY